MAKSILKKKSLSDKIVAKLNKPKNADYDIEDEDFNYNKSKNNDGDDGDDNSDIDDARELEELKKREHYVKVSKSKFRDDGVQLGDKYTGSKVGRSELFDDDAAEDDDENEEVSDGSDILADVTDSEEEIENNEDDDNEIQSEANSDDSESVDEEVSASESDNDDDEKFKRNRIAKLLDSEKQQIINKLSSTAKSDALKGYTILKQGSEYDNILDSRIKLQKAILSSNLLPIDSKSFEENKTKNTDSVLDSTEDKLYSLIDRLIRLRSNQLLKDGLIRNEIDLKLPNPKKRKLSAYIEQNNLINESLKPVTKSVLVKWSNRVQSASGIGALNQGKFNVINQNVWTQVNNQLNDSERLIKKTQINRRNVVPIGYEENKEEIDDDNIDSDDDENIKSAGLSNIDKTLQTNKYIFDDDDFYRLLLNDMINKKLDQKQSNNSAILMLSKNKMQKNYDRMATKGRKLKYTTQDQIVQFEIPRRKYYNWGDDQIDELFAGLFGMKFNMDDVESDNSEDENVHGEQNAEDATALRGSGVKMFG